MAFTSWEFLLLVAAGAVVYYALHRHTQWPVLLALSLVFYAAGGPGALVWLVAVAAVTWGAGLILDRMNEARKALQKGDKAGQQRIKRRKKAVVAVTAVLCFGLVYVMKYWNTTVALFPAAVEQVLPQWDFLMPLGLSFFTFQSVGYVIDVYRSKYAAQKNPAKYLLFVSFFPQMVQGPIGRYDALAPQLLAKRSVDWRMVDRGIQLALWGYFKKMVIADRAAVVVNTVIGENCPYGGAIIFVGILAYSIQLYCDFSGGIDITRGVAQIFGIDMAENFLRPIFATSLADYWRRWHVSLGHWMRDYLFYPLSLSKPFAKLGKWGRRHLGGLPGKILATSVATFVVYLVIGIWHGVNFRYFVYGIWNGTLITVSMLMEHRFLAWKQALHINDKSRGYHFFTMARTWLIVLFGRYIGSAPRLLVALSLMATTILHPVPSQLWDGTLLQLGITGFDWAVIGLGTVAVLAVETFQERGGHVRETLERQNGFVQWLTIAVPLIVILLLGVFRAGYISSSFIYGQY